MTPPASGHDPNENAADRAPPAPARSRFPRRRRLRHRLEFARVFDARLRRSEGPITLHIAPNDLPHARLGLSISRRVGNAVRRARLKRHLREAFRLNMGDIPHHEAGSYDLVISAHPHDEWPLARYRKTLIALAVALHEVHARRQRRAGDPGPPPANPGEP